MHHYGTFLIVVDDVVLETPIARQIHVEDPFSIVSPTQSVIKLIVKWLQLHFDTVDYLNKYKC